MNYLILIENRLPTGFCLGWSWYMPDEEFDYGEFILYVGFIAIKIQYEVQ